MCYIHWNFLGQKPRLMEIWHDIFYYPWKFHFLISSTMEFSNFFFSISLEIPCFCPPLIWIFLGTVQFLSKDLQCSHNWKMHLSFTNSSHTSAWSDHYCSHLEEPPHKFFTQKPSPMKSIFFWKKSSHTLGGSTIYTDYLVTLVHNSNK